jgi:hypothetical protein
MAFCAGGLMSLVTQFQSKANSGVLWQIESGVTRQTPISWNPGRHVTAGQILVFYLFMNPFSRNSLILQLFNLNPPHGDILGFMHVIVSLLSV